MKTFRKYIELREERKFTDEMLNEDPITVAGIILGYAATGLLLGWGGALIVQSYAKLANKTVNGIKLAYRKITGKNTSVSDVTKVIKEIKVDNKTKIQKNKQDEERSKYLEDFKDVFSAIEEKDENLTKEKIREVKLNPKLINRMVILEATKVFGEPPLHYGNTGNETYLFIKKVLGMKVAQAASFVVKKAFKSLGAELVQETEQ